MRYFLEIATRSCVKYRSVEISGTEFRARFDRFPRRDNLRAAPDVKESD